MKIHDDEMGDFNPNQSTTLATQMKVRRPPLDFSNLPKYWVARSPFATHFANVCNVIVPVGEQFFIDSVRLFRDQTEDAELRQQVRTFIGQEAWHKQVHERMWDRIEANGTPIKRFARWVQWGRELDRYLSPKMRLAVTAGLEHYTATMSESFFANDVFTKTLVDQIPKEVYDLLRWHGLEELEHKAVVFDLMQEVDNSYRLRASGFLVGSAFAIVMGLMGLALFLLTDKGMFQRQSKNSRGKRKSFYQGFRQSRFILSVAIQSAFSLLTYLKPGFHPNDRADPENAYVYLKSLEEELLED